jgi:hypothetical protein
MEGVRSMEKTSYELRHLLVCVRDYGPNIEQVPWANDDPYNVTGDGDAIREEEIKRAEDAGLLEVDGRYPGLVLTEKGHREVVGYRSYSGGNGIQAIPPGAQIA